MGEIAAVKTVKGLHFRFINFLFNAVAILSR